MNSGFETLGSLFFTSNETQTAMDDFLLADLAWNTMESQFSSVETQTVVNAALPFTKSNVKDYLDQEKATRLQGERYTLGRAAPL
ncbi:hypothetical protein GH733_009550 [Mirounga leonina]|nr:hypothetical protein GH733_009550 [Mirounga leonina]